MIWQVLHHLVALRRLGFDVWYVTDCDTFVGNPGTFKIAADPAATLEYLAGYFDRVGLGDRWIFNVPHCPERCVGSTASGLAQLYSDVDVAINLNGAQKLRPEHERIRRIVYLQTDPVGDQVAVALGDDEITPHLDLHHDFFTYGENIGSPDCLVPSTRYDWQPTRPPVCVDWWDNLRGPSAPGRLTTVANWNQHKDKEVVWQGERYYWGKNLEFRRFLDLPQESAVPLELALISVPERDLAELKNHGWNVIAGQSLADPFGYRDYIGASMGEFTVAKDQNVRMQTGWFSDRSACYLAAGRPVVTQDTGFGKILPTGEGLFAFQSKQDALAAIDAIAGDYARHSAAAREIAREFFAAETVLGNILSRIGLL
jgi:hypothetical protein